MSAARSCAENAPRTMRPVSSQRPALSRRQGGPSGDVSPDFEGREEGQGGVRGAGVVRGDATGRRLGGGGSPCQRGLPVHDPAGVRLQPPDGPALVDHPVDESSTCDQGPLLPVRARVVRQLVVDADQLQRGPGVDEPGHDGVLHGLRRRLDLQEPPGLLVAPPDERAGLLGVDPEGLHELDQDGRLLDRVQVLPVEVLLGLGEEPLLRVVEALVDQARESR